MKHSRPVLRRLGLLAVVLSIGLLPAVAAQDEAPLEGYGPWRFGMRHFEIAHFEEFGPYLPVDSTGGLETRNGVFEGDKTNVSFRFDDGGLEYVQIWAYEGSDANDMLRSFFGVYEHMTERYGDLMMGREKLVAGLDIEQLAELVPESFRKELPLISDEEMQRLGNARTDTKRLEIEPVWQPDGARVVAHLDRVEARGWAYVMLFYARPGEPQSQELSDVVEAPTGAADVVDTANYLKAQMISADAYAQRAGDSALLAQYPDLPGNPEAQFLQLSLGPSRAVAAIVGNFSSGFELRALPPAVPQPSELRFARDGDRFVLTAEFSAREQTPGGLSAYPVSLRFVMDEEDGGNKARIYPLAMRRGVLSIDGRDIEFGLTGDFGIFNGWKDTVYFDLDGNGSFSRPRNSSERFIVSDGYVTIDGRNWRFDVDRLGDKISLSPLDDSYPARAAIDEGVVAPDFSFVDADGTERRLSDYRGKMVLLDFWGVWCGPCHGEAPHLVAAYEQFHDQGFEIIGIDYRDEIEDQLAFMDEHGMSWPQARESQSDRPIHDLYRNWTWPTHYLLDENGVIIDFNPRGEDLIEALEAHFGR